MPNDFDGSHDVKFRQNARPNVEPACALRFVDEEVADRDERWRRAPALGIVATSGQFVGIINSFGQCSNWTRYFIDLRSAFDAKFVTLHMRLPDRVHSLFRQEFDAVGISKSIAHECATLYVSKLFSNLVVDLGDCSGAALCNRCSAYLFWLSLNLRC